MVFHLHALRFDFTARDTVRFPAGKPGNILRGALGSIFRQIVCLPECNDVRTCPRGGECPYARIFEPAARAPGPSGLSDWPRPFVFRAGHLDGATVHPGDAFHFCLNVFYLRQPGVSYFIRSFQRLAHEGLGHQRGRAELQAVIQLDERNRPVRDLFRLPAPEIAEPGEPLDLTLAPPDEKIGRILVRFTSPTELKAGKRLAERPDFNILFARTRDRISTLRALYQEGPLAIDFHAMGLRARDIRMTRCEVRWRDVMRRSSRTGQVHPIGGFTGEAEYAGNLTEFYPFLHAAQWTGVGRHTVWGKGAIDVEAFPAASGLDREAMSARA